MNYKRVTIDIDEADTAVSNWAEDNTNTFTDGVWGVDEAGVYHMFHHSRNDIVKFEEVHNPCPNCLHGWRRDVGQTETTRNAPRGLCHNENMRSACR